MLLPKWVQRLAPFAAGAALLLLITALISIFHPLPSGGSRSDLVGQDLGGQRAPAFQLVNARGEAVSLANLRGKAVALTFVYTSCPDICPLTAAKLEEAYSQLGGEADKVAIVAITVDPETDTPPRMEQYTQEMGLEGKWQFLTSTRTILTPVWSAYSVAPLTPQAAALLVADGPSTAQSNATFALAHTLAVYLIDPSGRERRLLDADFSASDAASDLRALASGA